MDNQVIYIAKLCYDSKEDNDSNDDCQYLSIDKGDTIHVRNISTTVDVRNPQGSLYLEFRRYNINSILN